MRSVEVTSRLRATAQDVWARAITPSGVNAELMPYVRMTFPRGLDRLDASDITPGQLVCRCWLLAGGVLPFDRHALAFEHVRANDEGYGFVETSTSWLQARWHHERSIVPVGVDTCQLTDRVSFESRCGLVAPLAHQVVRALFAHRHRRLRALWGTF